MRSYPNFVITLFGTAICAYLLVPSSIIWGTAYAFALNGHCGSALAHKEVGDADAKAQIAQIPQAMRVCPRCYSSLRSVMLGVSVVLLCPDCPLG